MLSGSLACEIPTHTDIIPCDKTPCIQIDPLEQIKAMYRINSKPPREDRSRSRSKEKYVDSPSTSTASAEKDHRNYEKVVTTKGEKPNETNKKNKTISDRYIQQLTYKEDLCDYNSLFRELASLQKNAESAEEITKKIPVSANATANIESDPRKRAFFTQPPTNYIKPNLVLDLDETLVNAALKSPELVDICTKKELMKDIQINTTCAILLALRPSLLSFLQEISKYYKVFLYTHGQKLYAEKVLELIDPEKVIFDRNQIFFNKGDNSTSIRTHKKTLKNLGFTDEEISRTLIIDDLKQVWVEHERVIPSKKFMPFFRSMEEEKYRTYTLDIVEEQGKTYEFSLEREDLESFSETKFDKNDQLHYLLPFLKDLAFKCYDSQRHKDFQVAFDMEKVLAFQMRRVLATCSVLIVTTDLNRDMIFKRLAQKLGSKINNGLEISNITHVVVDKERYNNTATKGYLERIRKTLPVSEKESKKVKIVDVDWLIQCYFTLEHRSSAPYLIK